MPAYKGFVQRLPSKLAALKFSFSINSSPPQPQTQSLRQPMRSRAEHNAGDHGRLVAWFLASGKQFQLLLYQSSSTPSAFNTPIPMHSKPIQPHRQSRQPNIRFPYNFPLQSIDYSIHTIHTIHTNHAVYSNTVRLNGNTAATVPHAPIAAICGCCQGTAGTPHRKSIRMHAVYK